MNILVCGDSFAEDDTRFPGIHWTHALKAEGHEVWNLASAGASNQFINLQVLQGITLKPDFVILLGTAPYRFELYEESAQKTLNQYPKDLQSIKEFNRIKWKSTSLIKDKFTREKLFGDYLMTYSHDMNIIQNYSHITNSLLALEYCKIPFCWQIGGFSKELDTVKNTSAVDIISKFNRKHVELNLWDLFNYDPTTADSLPSFHITEKSIHKTFANHCIKYINKV
jgi:hypothetical protein